jgi:hypothetical protein
LRTTTPLFERLGGIVVGVGVGVVGGGHLGGGLLSLKLYKPQILVSMFTQMLITQDIKIWFYL